MKQGKITKMQFKREWDSPQGKTIYYHDIELENGDKGSIGAKKQSPDFLAVGQELEYTIDGDKIKRVHQQGSGFGGGRKFDPAYEMWKQRLIVRQSCLKAAAVLLAGAQAIPLEERATKSLEIGEQFFESIWQDPPNIQTETPEQMKEMRAKALEELKPLMKSVGPEKFAEIYFHRYGQKYKDLNGKDAFQLKGLIKLCQKVLKETVENLGS